MGVDLSHRACPAWFAAPVLQGICHVDETRGMAASRAVARPGASGLMRAGVRMWCMQMGCASFGCGTRRDEAWESASGLWRCTCAAALCIGMRRLG